MWAKLYGEHQWPGLILLRKSTLIENRMLRLGMEWVGGGVVPMVCIRDCGGGTLGCAMLAWCEIMQKG